VWHEVEEVEKALAILAVPSLLSDTWFEQFDDFEN